MPNEPFTFNRRVRVTVEIGDETGGFGESWQLLTRQTLPSDVGLRIAAAVEKHGK